MSIRFQVICLLCVVTVPLSAVDMVQAGQAERELFAARFNKAADLYSRLVKSDPTWAPGYYGWVRSLLGAYKVEEASAAAEAAAKTVPGTAPAETAIALAAYVRGQIEEAERHFRLALQVDANYPGALMGMARILENVSKFKTARDLYKSAYRSAPTDPECILAGQANQQEGAARATTLERILDIYDPQARQARALRAQIALYKAAGDHKLRQLVSPYQRYDLNLLTLVDGPSPVRGAGLTVEIDQKKFKLLLATGASGIAISPKAAKKAGFQGLTGDGYSVLANEVRIGELKLADVPVAAVSGDPPANTDGLIGADVFREFLVSIDFLHGRLSLEPFAERPADPLDDAPDIPATGFTRALRVGNRLTLRTSVNGRDGYLFLIDSGSFRNLLGTNAARETTRVYATDRTRAESATLVFAGLSGYDPGMVTIDTRYVTDGTGLGQSGILGMPVLRGLRLTIDYREGSVRLEQIRP